MGSTLLGAIMPSASNGISADAEVTVGKKEEAVNTEVQVGDNTDIVADQVSTSNYGMEWWQLLLLVFFAGVAIPDFRTMGRGLIEFIRALLPFGGNK